MAQKPKQSKPMQTPQEWIKDKAEAYQLLGGINTKVSLYTNTPTEFRDISNLNFVTTNALTKRPGTTLFPGVTFAGTSAGGVTLGVPDLRQITSGYEFADLNGNSFLVISQFNNLYEVFNNGYSPMISYLGFSPPQSIIGSIYSYVTFANKLFACNGTEFYRIGLLTAGTNNQLNAFNYSVPSGFAWNNNNFQGFTNAQVPTGVAAQITGVSTAPYNVLTTGVSSYGLSGTYVFGYAFMNDRGFIGPPSNGVTMVLNGTSTYNAVQYVISNLNLPVYTYGATAIVLMRSQIDGVVMAGVTTIPISAGGATQIFYDYGIPLLNTAQVASQDYDVTQTYGSTVINQCPINISGYKLQPRYLEIYNNQMFMAGFSAAPSTFAWSEIGEPEGVQPSFNAQVRSNDGDRITGMKQYFGSLVITKKNSIHILTGSDPTNFTLQELSNQYGCLSNRTLVTWNNNLWFLDQKGIMEYNGANISCVSNKIEPIFNAMNIDAATENACGIHVKKYNEIWFSIPANGSTICNMIVVYDYIAQSWTHYDGIQAACLFTARAGLPNYRPFYGGYTGGLMYFDSALTSDNDQGITCSFDTLFLSARGQSVENMYRRLYLNVNPVLGFTQPITINFKSNFGTTVVLSNTMYQNPYQSRIDFGISARTLQFSMYHYSASLPLVIDGFTVESRLQRLV